ncbi:hypothetical protein DEA8626_00506 [Defluviimonas aquaemixtae]|uniref:DUF1178 family protein n=1 Tax=Albidovulum aquaemixtae TaxID=1542388 RepID=A0A2R8B358_9RHOB|nr:DUF1178 family protein [Defluviimonas aquaemixtae]SPH16992.1 hypothetical protein DEA8626_00506 [Defluviimonas aquaemixtae]
MIRYALICDKNHDFESWFQSAEAFDRLHATGMVACAVCGSAMVEKTLMAPTVRSARKAAAKDAPSLSKPSTGVEEMLAAMRRHIEETSDYVGLNFATEARAIHEGLAPERSIYGEARTDEAKKLVEDGVPVAPLPFLPARKAN